RKQYDIGVLLGGEPPPVGAKGEGGVLEPVQEGATGRVVDRDSGAASPGHRDPSPVGADRQPGRMARALGDRGTGRAAALLVREHDSVLARPHGKALPTGKVHGLIEQRLLTHRKALHGGQVSLPRHVPEVESPLEAGGEEGPAVWAERERPELSR